MTQLAPKPQPADTDLPPSTPRPGTGFNWKGIVIGIVIGAIASGVVGRAMQADPEPETGETQETALVPSRAVTTFTVENQAIAKTLDVVGTVAAADLIAVTSPRTGLQITQLLVEEGDTVQAGQLLAQLDNSTLQAELAQAQAQEAQAQARLAELKAGARSEEIARAQEQVTQAKAAVSRAQAELNLAQQRFDRNQSLLNSGAIAADSLDESRNRRDLAQASLDQSKASLREAEQRLKETREGTRPEVIAQAQAQLQQAQAQVNLVNTRLRETQIKAPRAGKVIEKSAQVGDLTSSSQPLFTLVEDGKLELQAKIPETQLNQVATGQQVIIRADSKPDWQTTGTIREIVPTVDQQSRQAMLKIDLPADGNLKPGMLLRAEIVTAEAPGISIPTKAVIPQDGEVGTVFVLDPKNIAAATEVRLGALLANDQIEILSGIQGGDRLVLEGAAYVKDGDLVEITDSIL